MKPDQPYWHELCLVVFGTAAVVLILLVAMRPTPLPSPRTPIVPDCRENYVSLRRGVCVPGYATEGGR